MRLRNLQCVQLLLCRPSTDISGNFVTEGIILKEFYKFLCMLLYFFISVSYPCLRWRFIGKRRNIPYWETNTFSGLLL